MCRDGANHDVSTTIRCADPNTVVAGIQPLHRRKWDVANIVLVALNRGRLDIHFLSCEWLYCVAITAIALQIVVLNEGVASSMYPSASALRPPPRRRRHCAWQAAADTERRSNCAPSSVPRQID